MAIAQRMGGKEMGVYDYNVLILYLKYYTIGKQNKLKISSVNPKATTIKIKQKYG